MAALADYGIDTCWFNPAGEPRETDAEISYEIRKLSQVSKIVGV